MEAAIFFSCPQWIDPSIFAQVFFLTAADNFRPRRIFARGGASAHHVTRRAVWKVSRDPAR